MIRSFLFKTAFLSSFSLACLAQDESTFHVFYDAYSDDFIVFEESGAVISQTWYSSGLQQKALPASVPTPEVVYYSEDPQRFSFRSTDYNTRLDVQLSPIEFYASPIDKRACKELSVSINGSESVTFGFIGMVQGSFVGNDAYGNAIPALPQHLTGEAILAQLLEMATFSNDKNQRLKIVSELGKIKGLQIDGKSITTRFDVESGTFMEVAYQGKKAMGTLRYDENCSLTIVLMDIGTGSILNQFFYDAGYPGF